MIFFDFMYGVGINAENRDLPPKITLPHFLSEIPRLYQRQEPDKTQTPAFCFEFNCLR